jgi:peptidoglycan/xylan/chitin deacetylase (PgdA/CDA1 family)
LNGVPYKNTTCLLANNECILTIGALISNILNIMSVDLEDYYSHLPLSKWNKYESRAVNTTKTILELFEKYNMSATFFTVGYIAKNILN